MRIVRALPGTLGLLALVVLPAAAAVFNLSAGLGHLRSTEAPPSDRPTAIVGQYVTHAGGDDTIELKVVHVSR